MEDIARAEFMENISKLLNDRVDDDALTLLEYFTQIADEYDKSDGENWQEKYNELDNQWRERYKARFFAVDSPEETPEETTEEAPEESITIDELFKEE